ncbi:MAG TPA: iron uptake transporter permease EfeU [Acidimicrobiia bacterium]|nr:iron uptake transporter permease EfeU [Acidimicrobiia bacterium]
MAGFLVMLREGVEAALIVAILLAFLVRSGQGRGVRWVWSGTVAAAAVSLVAGVVIFQTIGSLEGRPEQIAEGTVALVATGLLTWMIFWMGSRARSLKGHLEDEAGSAIASGGTFGLAAVAFIAVLREGLESALFMISVAVGIDAQGVQFLGGLLGLIGAVGIGYLVYRGGRRIDLRQFFRITGILIVIVAAGLIGKAIHEFQEAGFLPMIVEHVWTLRFLDPSTSVLGSFAKTLFGISHNPSMLTLAGYWAYLIPVLLAFLRMTGRRPVPAASV